MDQYLVSVIIATHNRDSLLPVAVNSILNQTYQNFEILIIDDASEDYTPIIISYLKKKDTRIKSFRSETNIGPGKARNIGIANANGDLIAILDDDDIAIPNRLAVQVKFLDTDPNIDVVFSATKFQDNDNNKCKIYPSIDTILSLPESSDELFKQLYVDWKWIVLNTTIMARRKVLDQIKYVKKPWRGEDHILVSMIAASGFKMKGIPQPLVTVNRSMKREGLMVNKCVNNFKAALIIKRWIKKNKPDKFQDLHKKAMSNSLLNEQHYANNYFKAILYFLFAFLIWPQSPKVQKKIRHYYEKYIKGFARIN